MRIIGGIAGGVNIEAPDGRELRPTESRVKESLFGTLGDLRGKVVVDLFSGSGSLGLEALSRGAAKVVMVEKQSAHVAFIEGNLQAVRKAMGENCGQVQVLCCDVRNVLPQLAELRPDVVLADPPYAAEYGAVALATDANFAAWAKGALLVLEHSSDTFIPESLWELIRLREFGIRALSFMRCLD